MIRIIDDWRDCWKFLSNWVFAFILATPDAYNAVSAMFPDIFDAMPTGAANVVRLMAVIGLIVRQINQTKREV